MVWNPQQYARFAKERRQPFYDLVDRIEPQPRMNIVDLGCGSGALTCELHQRLGAASTLGIDNSEAMLADSAELAGDGVSFEHADIGSLSGRGPYDLVFSNAALHWLPEHRGLFERLTAMVANAGQLAIQVPANHDHIASTLADEVASESPFCEAVAGYTRGVRVLDPRDYAELLHELGYAKSSVVLKIYGHVLASVHDVVEWMKGALLTDFERRMPAALFPAFVSRYRDRLVEGTGDPRPYYFTYKRILMVARR